MKATVRELAALVAGRIVGDPDVSVTGFAGIEHAGPDHITFVAQEKYLPLLKATRAAAVVLQSEMRDCPAVQIIVVDPNLAFARLVDLTGRAALRGAGGIDARAVVAPTAEVDRTATIGPCAVIAGGARIGARCVVGAGVYVGEDATVGEDSLLHPNVTVLRDVCIGRRVIVHSGAVLGADGFGYATDAAGVHQKIPQIGTVVVEDDVEIGAGTCIDRARFHETRIGHGTKIDNQVMIGHNVVVGPHCIIVAQSGIAGSSELGHHVVLGAKVGVGGHVKLGDGLVAAAMSGISNSLPGGQNYVGQPALPYGEGMRVRVLFTRLPEMRNELRDALRRIADLEARLAQGGAGGAGR